jgi:hypothetical protein
MPLHRRLFTSGRTERKSQPGTEGTLTRLMYCRKGGTQMQLSEIHDYARRLTGAFGPEAIAQAAQRARKCEELGDDDQAATWRAIERVLTTSRGPSVS